MIRSSVRFRQAAPRQAAPQCSELSGRGPRRTLPRLRRVDAEDLARRSRCHTFVIGDGLVTPEEVLASVGGDVVPDVYGEGGVVAELESTVSELLGHPAAVFLPSGTMA